MVPTTPLETSRTPPRDTSHAFSATCCRLPIRPVPQRARKSVPLPEHGMHAAADKSASASESESDRPSHNRCTVHPVRVGHTPWPSRLPSGVCLGTPAGVICLRLHRQATGPSPPRARDPSRVNSRDIVQRTAPPADSPSGPSWARWAALGEFF